MKDFVEIQLNNETWFKSNNIEKIEAWFKDGGWEDSDEVYDELGVSSKELQDKYFQIAAGRLFVADEEETIKLENERILVEKDNIRCPACDSSRCMAHTYDPDGVCNECGREIGHCECNKLSK